MRGSGLLRAASLRPVQAAARLVVPPAARLFPTNPRVRDLADRVISVLAHAGALDSAARIGRRVGSASPDRDLHQRALHARLLMDAGTEVDVGELVDALMTRAEQGVPALAADAVRTAYHPLRITGPRIAAIVEDGDPCLARIAGSPLFTWQPRRPDAGRIGSPRRLLVVTSQNLRFLGTALARWERDPAVELRVRELSGAQVPDLDSLIAARSDRTPPVLADRVAEDAAWADVVFCDWADLTASALSLAALPCRVVVRLHRYEAFRESVPMTAEDGIDQLLLVSAPVRAMLGRTAPGRLADVETAIVPLEIDLDRFDRPKVAAAGRTLALVGYNAVVKDPAWALDVLEQLRHGDPTWRLMLVGTPRPAADDPATRDYFRAFDARAAALGDAVVRVDQTDDVPGVLRDASVILSSSRAESLHAAVVEGVASGCLPVVRDWPDLTAIDAARTVYPAEWVVRSAADAADRIRTADADDRLRARDWVRDAFDPARTADAFDRAVFGEVAEP